MRHIVLVILLGGAAFGQSIVENAAAAAGGSVGGAAGKKVSEGLTAIFGKVDKQTAQAAHPEKAPGKTKAAQPDKSAADGNVPLLAVSPGVVKGTESVPPPPPMHRAAMHKPVPLAPRPVPGPEASPGPPPPEVTAADLKRVATGMNRDELLQLGAPAMRITMFDDGHLVEVYRYMAKDTTLGVVRLSDGTVSTVEVR